MNERRACIKQNFDVRVYRQNLNFALRKPTDLLAQLLLTKRFVEAKCVGTFTHVTIFYVQMSFKST